ncbi:hypothetical protein OSTOST_09252 [Ostertagia ostertagi]
MRCRCSRRACSCRRKLGGLALTDADYGWITFAFTAAYAAFPPLIGTAIDRLRRQAQPGRGVAAVVRRRRGAWPGGLGPRPGARALPAGHGRGRALPRGDQGRGDVVPAAGASPGHGRVQCGDRVGRHRLTADGVAGAELRLALRLHGHRRGGAGLAAVLAEGLSRAGAAPAGDGGRARPHPRRPAAAGSRPAPALDGAAALQGDLALPDRPRC